MAAHGDNRRKCKKCLRQWGFLMIGGAWRKRNKVLAEREGFEPPIRLPVCRISSAVLSTTQPPLLRGHDLCHLGRFCQGTILVGLKPRNDTGPRAHAGRPRRRAARIIFSPDPS